MKTLQWLLLITSVALGIVWIFICQNWIFLNLFAGILVGGGLTNLNAFLQTGSSPAFTVLWAGCITALMIWIGITWSSKPTSSKQTRQMQPMWWIAAGSLSAFGWLCLSWFTIFQWQVTGVSPTQGGTNFYPVPAGGWLLLLGFVLIDVVLLFWLPTLLASPRTYRFVVPGAVNLLGSR